MPATVTEVTAVTGAAGNIRVSEPLPSSTTVSSGTNETGCSTAPRNRSLALRSDSSTSGSFSSAPSRTARSDGSASGSDVVDVKRVLLRGQEPELTGVFGLVPHVVHHDHLRRGVNLD